MGKLGATLGSQPLIGTPHPPLSEMGLQIHVTPLFSGQGLGLCSFPCIGKPKFIATGALLPTSGAHSNFTCVQTQGLRGFFDGRKVPPLLLARVRSAKNRLPQGVWAFEVGNTMQIVLTRSYVLQISNCIVAFIHIPVIDLRVLWSWWRPKKSICHKAMNTFLMQLR